MKSLYIGLACSALLMVGELITLRSTCIPLIFICGGNIFCCLFSASMIPPQFSERLQTKEVKEGAAVQFSVHISGNPPPTVTWFREGSQIVSSPDFEIQCSGEVHSLYIPEVFYEDSGKFSVQAENPAGLNSCTAELIVEGKKTTWTRRRTRTRTRNPSYRHLSVY